MLASKELIPSLELLCRKVGAYQLSFFRRNNFSIAHKSSAADLVTSVDLGSDQMISAELKRLLPHAAILTEESGFTSGESSYKWIVDPLDGTNNFAQGIPVFTISIALHHHDEPFLGVIYNPCLDEFYWAVKGEGAYCNGERLQVSSKTTLATCILATGFPYDKDAHPVNNLNYLAALIPKTRGIRRLGSAAYDLCLTARGNFDGYWELNLQIWDIAAGVLLVSEAGGTVNSFRTDRSYSIVAAAPCISELLLKELAQI